MTSRANKQVDYVQASAFTSKASLTVATSSGAIYTAGDQVGVVMTLDQIPLEDSAICTITDIVVIDKSNTHQNAALSIFFYNDSVTGVADNAAASLSDADQIKCDGRVDIAASDYVNMALNSVASVPCYRQIRSASNSQIRVIVVTTGTPTYTSTSDLVLNIGFALDYK